MSNSCLYPSDVNGLRAETVINTLFWLVDMRANVVIDVSAKLILGVVVNMLTDAGVIVVTAEVIGFEARIKVLYDVEVLVVV